MRSAVSGSIAMLLCFVASYNFVSLADNLVLNIITYWRGYVCPFICCINGLYYNHLNSKPILELGLPFSTCITFASFQHGFNFKICLLINHFSLLNFYTGMLFYCKETEVHGKLD